jgi:hypothetical protein
MKIQRLIRLFLHGISIRRLWVLVSLLYLGNFLLFGCNKGLSEPEEELEKTFARISTMVDEYYKLPVKHRQLSSGVLVWRDRAAADSFYKQHSRELSRIDQELLELLNREQANTLKDDALLGRGICYWLLSELQPAVDTQERAIGVWTEIGNKAPLHLRDFAKASTQKSFLSRFEAILTPTLSFEENVDVVFHVLRAQALLRMKKYASAIEVNEIVAKRYPSSTYADKFVKSQIETIRDLKAGKISVPDQP